MEAERLQLGDGLGAFSLSLCFEFSDELGERRHARSMGDVPYSGRGRVSHLMSCQELTLHQCLIRLIVFRSANPAVAASSVRSLSGNP